MTHTITCRRILINFGQVFIKLEMVCVEVQVEVRTGSNGGNTEAVTLGEGNWERGGGSRSGSIARGRGCPLDSRSITL